MGIKKSGLYNSAYESIPTAFEQKKLVIFEYRLQLQILHYFDASRTLSLPIYIIQIFSFAFHPLKFTR